MIEDTFEHNDELQLRHWLLLALLVLSGPGMYAISLVTIGNGMAGRRAILYVFCVAVPTVVLARDHRWVV